jgi:hypothetical protein
VPLVEPVVARLASGAVPVHGPPPSHASELPCELVSLLHHPTCLLSFLLLLLLLLLLSAVRAPLPCSPDADERLPGTCGSTMSWRA